MGDIVTIRAIGKKIGARVLAPTGEELITDERE
jgi:hypothetical protein